MTAAASSSAVHPRAKPKVYALADGVRGGFFLWKKPLGGVLPGYSYSGFAEAKLMEMRRLSHWQTTKLASQRIEFCDSIHKTEDTSARLESRLTRTMMICLDFARMMRPVIPVMMCTF
jgi:hypothetical protein